MPTSPVNVDIPALGESVREALLIKWHKNDGDTVAEAEPLAELETDKANVDIPSPAAGVLRRVKKEGETVAIGETIARIEEGGSRAQTQKTPPANESQAAPPRDQNTSTPSNKDAKAESTATSSAKLQDFRPSVRKMVEENKLNPGDLKGTGPRGQVTKDDAVRALDRDRPTASSAPASPVTPAPAAPPAPAPAGISKIDYGADGTARVPMSRIRKKIAERLVEAQHTAAILSTFNEIDMTAIIELRAKFKEKFERAHGVGLGFMSFFARACVLAIREFPNVNAQLDEQSGSDIIYHRYVNVGIAVSTDRGLAVPVLRNVEQMSFGKIENEIKRLAAATREGKLSLQELSGGTFTITNGGVFGSLLSTPIINPPQSAILGMHAIQKRPIAVNDRVEIRPMMYVALSYDHRLIDGRESVSFLVRVKEYLEDPARLMLEV